MNRENRAVLLALAAVALWSTVAVAFKLALRDLAPVDLVILSSFVSWLGLGAVMLVRLTSPAGPGMPRPTKRSILSAGLLGLLNPVAYYLVLFAAYDRLPAQAAQPLNYTWPLFLALLAAPISRRFPSLRELLAILVSFVGVVLISWRPSSSADRLDTIGVFLALGSGIIWALYWLAGSRVEMDGPSRLFAGFTLAVVVLAVLWWRRGFPVPVSAGNLAAVVWVGLFEMGITFLFWNGALEHTARPARIGNLVYLGPFISLIWIRLILGEHIRPATIAGLAVIIVGILYGQGILLRRNSGNDM